MSVKQKDKIVSGSSGKNDHRPKLNGHSVITGLNNGFKAIQFAGGIVRDAKLSHGEHGSGNLLIHGDNLEALAALRPQYAGKVRCIYIDPPYNNKERYNHYDDDIDHEIWLAALSERLLALVDFLRADGSLWISIDDRELHYLKVAADKVLGRKNFISTIVWEHRTTRENRKVFSNNHEYLLVYARDARIFRNKRNLLPATPELLKRYRNPDNDLRGPWQSVSVNVQAGHATPNQFYSLVAPNGRSHTPPPGRCWIYSKEKMEKEIEAKNIWFGLHGNNVPRLKRFLAVKTPGFTPETLWRADAVGTTDSAKKHSIQMFPKERVFDTPKPEALIHRVIKLATDPNDIVLDAYLGSGTTAAVAHKMKRHYVGIESGSHAITHCAQRLKMVVDGEEGGISKRMNWLGGGGFDFYRLKESRNGFVCHERFRKWKSHIHSKA